jgi:thiamine pyrophosphokinase
MNPGRTALIVGSAPVISDHPHYARLIREADLLVAADGGVALCLEAGRAPDVCVGDLDSAPEDALGRAIALGTQIRRHPAEKSESDLDLAVALVRERETRSVVFTAAFSGRIDHTLAGFGTLLRAADLSAMADEPDWKAYALDANHRPELVLDEPRGTVLSVFSLSGDARVTIGGVAYPLSEHRMPPLSSLGLSNEATTSPQRITVSSGSVLVVVNAASGTLPLQS